MTYAELIARVLNGKSVNAVAHELNIPQKTLDRYVKAESMPSVSVALMMARRAGVSVEEAVQAIADEETKVRPKRAYILPRLAATAAGLLVSVNLFLTHSPTEAAPVKAQMKSGGQETLRYVKCLM